MIKFIKDLGMKQTPTTKRRFYLVECSECGNQYEMQSSQFKAGYTALCKKCNITTHK